ncbi:MAG: LacI family DNA-binding transcriptional regulator [Lachnospiraceae bacterium]|nr:LacI family DNA-binding transcriptional regulator [Lachnospiraceae bacterium]
MPTMQEIAALAGVSRGTVDRVLNNRGGVSEETKKKILEIAEMSNYEPNKAGIALAVQKRNLKIGVLLFEQSGLFFEDIKKGLAEKNEELSVYGISLLYRQTDFDEKAQVAGIRELVESGINGLIIAPCNHESVKKELLQLEADGIPVITVNTDINDSHRLAYVGSNPFKCGQVAGGLMGMITGGSGRVGIITGSHELQGHEARVQGFTEILGRKFPGLVISDIEECKDDDYRSYEIVQKMLSDDPDITAFFFTAGGVYGGCKAIAAAEGDYKVITFDDIETTREYIRSDIITATICQDPVSQGSRALSLLADVLVLGKLPDEATNYTDINIKIKESL